MGIDKKLSFVFRYILFLFSVFCSFLTVGQSNVEPAIVYTDIEFDDLSKKLQLESSEEGIIDFMKKVTSHRGTLKPGLLIRYYQVMVDGCSRNHYDSLYTIVAPLLVDAYLSSHKYYKAFEITLNIEKNASQCDCESRLLTGRLLQSQILLGLGLIEQAESKLRQCLEMTYKSTNAVDKFRITMIQSSIEMHKGNYGIASYELERMADTFILNQWDARLIGLLFYQASRVRSVVREFDQAYRFIKLGASYIGMNYGPMPELQQHFHFCELYAFQGKLDLFRAHRIQVTPLVGYGYSQFNLDFLEAVCHYYNGNKFLPLYDKFNELADSVLIAGDVDLFLQMSDHLIDVCNGLGLADVRKDIKHRRDRLVETNINRLINEYGQNQAELGEKDGVNVIGIVGVVVIICGMVLLLFVRQRAGEKSGEEGIEEVADKEEVSSVSPAFLKNIEASMNDREILCDPSLSLTGLAQLLNTNTTYLSKAINSHYQTNFSSFVTQRRIDLFCQMVKTSEYANYKIEVLAEMIGYKSKSTFNKHFKLIMGVTPSAYLSTLEEETEEDKEL